MKQINFKKSTGQGNIDGICRISGRFIYFKYNDSVQSKQAVEEFRKKGIKIREGKGWIQVDLLGDNETARLGDEFIDTEESDEITEEKLFKFYVNQFNKLGFYTDTGDAYEVAT